VGTSWSSPGAPDDPSCDPEQVVTFREGGVLDYTSRCGSEDEPRTYSGEDDNSTWTLVDGKLTLSLNDGFNVCSGPINGGKAFRVSCKNREGESFKRTYSRE